GGKGADEGGRVARLVVTGEADGRGEGRCQGTTVGSAWGGGSRCDCPGPPSIRTFTSCGAFETFSIAASPASGPRRRSSTLSHVGPSSTPVSVTSSGPTRAAVRWSVASSERLLTTTRYVTPWSVARATPCVRLAAVSGPGSTLGRCAVGTNCAGRPCREGA